MTMLVWGQEDQKTYEAGVYKGVLFPPEGPGVVWNGLVSVVDKQVGSGTEPLYFDGIRYLNLQSYTDYQATIQAFSAPEELSDCLGDVTVVPGFRLTGQPKTRFGLSYRVPLNDGGYKLHVVYNALATRSSQTSSTLSDSPDAPSMEWTIDAVPPTYPTVLASELRHRPSAHFIVDSRTPPVNLSDIEDALYGTVDDDPYLLPFDEFLALF